MFDAQDVGTLTANNVTLGCNSGGKSQREYDGGETHVEEFLMLYTCKSIQVDLEKKRFEIV